MDHDAYDWFKTGMARIGQSAARMMPAGWTDLAVTVLVPDEGLKVFLLFYTDKSGTGWRNLQEVLRTNEDLEDAYFDFKDVIADFRELCVSEEQGWTKLTYRLSAAGHFDCDLDDKPLRSVNSAMIKEETARITKRRS